MNRLVLATCGLIASLCVSHAWAQGRGGGGGSGQGGGCRGGNMPSQSSQASRLTQSSLNFDQLANPFQQPFAQQAARQQAVQSVFQQQMAYQQQQALKRQARRDRQLAAIARRKAEEATRSQPASTAAITREQLADRRR